MKEWYRYAAIILLPLIGFALLDRIVSVRLLEMQYQMQRDRFLNFELSSELLIARMRNLTGERITMKRETDGAVLETSVMKRVEGSFRPPSESERLALFTINLIRFMSLKSALRIESDVQSLKMIQTAFYLERTKHYANALQAYRETIATGNLASDAEAFSMLHLGFCNIVLGDIEEALLLLERVRSEHASDHFGETADTLIRMLLAGDRKAKEIQDRNYSPLQKALKLAEIGRCSVALQYFKKSDPKDDEARFAMARCQEETGEIEQAAVVYRDLILNGSRSIRRKSSRRLALSAEYYGLGEKARKFAEKAMQDDGDEEGMSVMRDADRDRESDPSDDENLPESLSSLKKEAMKRRESMEGMFSRLPEKKIVMPPIPGIVVQIRGGVPLTIKNVVLDTTDLEGYTDRLRVTVMLSEIRTIEPEWRAMGLRVFLKSGASFVANRLDTVEGRGFDDGSGTIHPFGDIVRIVPERIRTPEGR